MEKIKNKKIPKAIEGTMLPCILKYDGSCIQRMNTDSKLTPMISECLGTQLTGIADRNLSFKAVRVGRSKMKILCSISFFFSV